MEIRAAPGLPGRHLGKFGAAPLKLLEQRMHIRDFGDGEDERDFPGGKRWEGRLLDEAQIQAGSPARHRTIEGRRAVKKVDLKSQRVAEEGGARRDVPHQQDRDMA